MTAISPDKIVADWGGFEKLVANLHETGSVTVKHNVKLKGQSGATRQIDVLITHTEGLYDHLILVECKHWNSNIKRMQVDAMATSVKDLKASKGVIFTTKDFQSGAVTAAQAFGVDLIRVREFADSEWGRPGRHIDFFMQYFQRSVGNLQVSATTLALHGEQPAPIHLNLQIGNEETGEGTTSTATVKLDGTSGDNLEKIIIDKSAEALAQLVNKNNFLMGDGDGIDRYVATRVDIQAPNNLIVPIGSRNVIVSKISLDLAVKITQNRFQLDRKALYQFVLAIENKVTGRVMAATRAKDSDITDLARLQSDEPNEDNPILENGSTLKITLKGFFPFEEYLNASKIQGTPKVDAPIPEARSLER